MTFGCIASPNFYNGFFLSSNLKVFVFGSLSYLLLFKPAHINIVNPIINKSFINSFI